MQQLLGDLASSTDSSFMRKLLPHTHVQGVKQSVCPSVIIVIVTKSPDLAF